MQSITKKRKLASQNLTNGTPSPNIQQNIPEPRIYNESPLILSLPLFLRHGNRTLPSLLEQNWHNTQNDRDTDDNGLDTEYKTQSVPSNPGRLEVSDGETTAGAPHVQDRGDDGRLVGVFL